MVILKADWTGLEPVTLPLTAERTTIVLPVNFGYKKPAFRGYLFQQ